MNKEKPSRRDPLIIIPVHYKDGTSDLTVSSKSKVELEVLIKDKVTHLINEINGCIDFCNSGPYTQHVFEVEAVLMKTYIELIDIYPSLKNEFISSQMTARRIETSRKN